MSLHLQVVVGGQHYLLDAGCVVEVREDLRRRERRESRQGQGRRQLQVIDLRRLFAEAPGASGWCILCSQPSGEPATLLVDRVAGLVDLDAAEFFPLPSIAPLGPLIDAISSAVADGRPMLRLRAEHAIAVIRNLAE